MFSKTFKRCLASLCLSVILAGVLSPATVYADVSYDGNYTYVDTGNQYTIEVNNNEILEIQARTADFTEAQEYFTHISTTLNITEAANNSDALAAYVEHYKSNTSIGAANNSFDTLALRLAIALCCIYYGEGLTPEVQSDLDSIFTSTHNGYDSAIAAYPNLPYTYNFTASNLGILNYIDESDIDSQDYKQKALVAAAECLHIYQLIPAVLNDLDEDSIEYSTLVILTHQMNKAFAESGTSGDIELLTEVYEHNYSVHLGDSLSDIYDNIGSSGDLNATIGNQEAWVEYTSTYVAGDSPLDLFYQVNIPEKKTVFTSYNRDYILNDVNIDDNLDNLLYKSWEEWKRLDKQYKYDDYWSGAVIDAGASYINATDIVNIISTYQSFNSNDNMYRDKSGYGTSVGGDEATTAGAVTLSEHILEGMAYSTTYVPMKTNLYSVDVLSSYPKEFLEDFYYRYGFNRKALYIDTSASSVMDYYVSGGRSAPTTRVCTLRDLLESEGKDITLYIDSGFYNGTDAKEMGTEYLNTRYNYLINLRDDLLEYLETEAILNQTTLESITSNVAHTVVSIMNNVGFIPDSTAEEFDQLEELRDEWEDEIYPSYKRNFADRYNIDIEDYDDLNDVYNEIDTYLSINNPMVIDDAYLKDNDYSTTYRAGVRASLSGTDVSDYRDIYSSEVGQTVQDAAFSWLADVFQNMGVSIVKTHLTENNFDAIVMDSYAIGQYMSHDTISSELVETDEGYERNYISGFEDYNPLQGLAFISLLYREQNAYGLSNVVETAQPVFMASDDMCAVKDAGQWYRNSLLNYALVQNLPAMVQIDYNYACDIDAPLYMDIFGNILTESGTVVVPAASNATLHTGAYKYSNLAVGLYSCYGKEYSVPIELAGAYSVLSPYFTPDFNTESYVISNLEITLNGESIKLNHINQYSVETCNIVQTVYKQAIRENSVTNSNWMAMIHIINEVLRGAPIEYIDRTEENIVTATGASKSTIIAAIKLESLIDSLKGEMSNTLMCIPDFTRNDNTEYWVALLIKIMLVAVTGVIIVAIYRDGVSGQLGIRTLTTCLSSVLLTFLCIVLVPAIFQLTYYSANKFLLEEEAFRILMVNTEKYNLGTEIAMTGTREPESSDEFSLQLDWIDVPWYEEINSIMFESGLSHLQETKLEAYRNTPTYYNNDVDVYNDGVYISTNTLFDSVKIDYKDSGSNQGLYLYSDNNSDQTTSFYSPYYVFLRILCANVNEYNQGRNYVNDDGTVYVGDSDYTYTTKYMKGNKLKTVGICEAYFTSEDFMVLDTDIMHLYQIYGSPDNSMSLPKDRHSQLDQHFNRALLFNEDHLKQFQASLWYNDLGDAVHLDDRVAIMDQHARDFIAENKDMLGRVSDETFIKVMSLYMSVKYNQLFGVTHANALEIYNLDSTDLLRLCLTTDEEAALTSPMSYSRYIATFGGEASVYAAAVLYIIMYIGSFIKPLCTVIVYVSVFMSIFVFKVVLRKPSANLWGYFVTCVLLCATNFLHALLLKISVNLPATGLSMLGCIVFMIFGQVCYLLVLAYVTGVSCKDWSNLGANEYAKEAASLKSKFGHRDDADKLNGRIKHHEDNWEYYNDLMRQHRSRNKT